MAKVLFIGDPHAKPDCLDEMERLITYIGNVASDQRVDFIVFLGDQFHTHSVIHLSVLAFWRNAFARLQGLYGCPAYALVGNHDISGKFGDTNNALMLFNPDVIRVVDGPKMAPWGALMVPYQHSKEKFVEICNQFPEVDTVICHQTFDGSKYENGFPAKDGVEPHLIPQKNVISGHIHTPQTIGKIWYPGAPRWQTVADANVQRAIWVVDTETGQQTAFSTDKVCIPIYLLVDRPEEPITLPTGHAEITVDVYGDAAHVKTRSAELEKLGVRVRPFPTRVAAPKVKESDGLPLSLKKFISQYKSKQGTPSAKLLALAQHRISWMKVA